jgi:hypothetical protein
MIFIRVFLRAFCPAFKEDFILALRNRYYNTAVFFATQVIGYNIAYNMLLSAAASSAFIEITTIAIIFRGTRIQDFSISHKAKQGKRVVLKRFVLFCFKPGLL